MIQMMQDAEIQMMQDALDSIIGLVASGDDLDDAGAGYLSGMVRVVADSAVYQADQMRNVAQVTLCHALSSSKYRSGVDDEYKVVCRLADDMAHEAGVVRVAAQGRDWSEAITSLVELESLWQRLVGELYRMHDAATDAIGEWAQAAAESRATTRAKDFANRARA